MVTESYKKSVRCETPGVVVCAPPRGLSSRVVRIRMSRTRGLGHSRPSSARRCCLVNYPRAYCAYLELVPTVRVERRLDANVLASPPRRRLCRRRRHRRVRARARDRAPRHPNHSSSPPPPPPRAAAGATHPGSGGESRRVSYNNRSHEKPPTDHKSAAPRRGGGTGERRGETPSDGARTRAHAPPPQTRSGAACGASLGTAVAARGLG